MPNMFLDVCKGLMQYSETMDFQREGVGIRGGVAYSLARCRFDAFGDTRQPLYLGSTHRDTKIFKSRYNLHVC